jgi:asparagine synthase (glutamine-hydrolysing)
MCGLAGFVIFDRDRLDAHVELALKPMVEALRCRGPDAQASWLDAQAALGHTRLAIIDLAGGAQPMTAEQDGQVRAVLVFTGEVYNHQQLRSELQARGHTFRTESDTEVVLAGYLAWGEDFVSHLDGMFAFAIWNPSHRKLLLGRDRLGVKPLFYQQRRGQIRFGSEPKALLAHPGAVAAVDVDGLRELVLASHPMINTPGRAVFTGMAEVPPGCLVLATPERTVLRRYWSLPTREHTDDLPATVEAVRSLITQAVTSHLRADVPRCTLLSGGLDSSVIAALAQDGDRQDTVSVDLGAPQDPARDAMRRSWDAPFVELMANRLGSRHREVVIAPEALAAPSLRAQVIAARDGLSLGDFDLSVLLLFRAVRERHTVALSGDGADETFGGYRWFESGRVQRDFPWAGVIDRGDLTRLLAPRIVAALDLSGHRRDLYRQARGELEHPPGASAAERGLRLNSYLNLTRFLPGLLERTDRLSMSGALEVRVPFCDHRLVEYVFNVPWALKTFDGREKSLLRAAAAGLVPEQILQRRKSPYPMIRDPAYRRLLTDQVSALLHGDSPALALLDVPATRDLLLEARLRERFPREGLELVLDLDLWLRRYRPLLTL